MNCVRCGNILKGRQTRYCSDKCSNLDAVTRYRRNRKQKLVEAFGGKCTICGYDRCIDALQFHHLDPTQKEFGIGSGDTMSFIKLMEEASKCQLVCANCHVEIHSGIANGRHADFESAGVGSNPTS